jgi:hypothetical protein
VKYKSLSELEPVEFTRVETLKPLELRRRRLERLASLLESHTGPVRLFTQVEAVPGRRRRAMRRDSSPFFIAFQDPVFRTEGLGSDTIGEATAFFGLSTAESHELVCDCHYFGPVTGSTVAERARHMAMHPSLSARMKSFFAGFSPWRPAAA